MDKFAKIHMCLLVLIQWVGLAVVILNGVAVSLPQNNPQLGEQLVSPVQIGLQDKLMIITGVLSFLAATFSLCLHLRLSYQPSRRHVFVHSIKKVLIGELITGIVMIIFVTATSTIAFAHFHVASNWASPACKMVELAITLGFCAIAGWVLLLIITSINMARLPMINTPEFILETNPYLVAHNISLEEKNAYASADTAAPPYTPLSPQLPPPTFSSVVMPLRHSHHMINVHPLPSIDYPPDTKYPIYSIDSLPVIQSGTSKFDLSFEL